MNFQDKYRPASGNRKNLSFSSLLKSAFSNESDQLLEYGKSVLNKRSSVEFPVRNSYDATIIPSPLSRLEKLALSRENSAKNTPSNSYSDRIEKRLAKTALSPELVLSTPNPYSLLPPKHTSHFRDDHNILTTSKFVLHTPEISALRNHLPVPIIPNFPLQSTLSTDSLIGYAQPAQNARQSFFYSNNAANTPKNGAELADSSRRNSDHSSLERNDEPTNLGRIGLSASQLLQMAELINSDIKLDRVTERLLDVAAHIVHSERLVLYLLQEDRDMLVVQSCKGIPGATNVSCSKGLAGYCAKTGRSLILNGYDIVRSDWRYDKDADLRENIEVCSVIYVIVRASNGSTIGLLELLNSSNGFNDYDETMLRALSMFISTVVQKDTLEIEALQRRRQADALLQVAELTSADFGVVRAIQRITKSANLILNCNCEAIQFFEVEGSDLICTDYLFNDDVPSDILKERVKYPINSGFLGQCAFSGKAVLVNECDWLAGDSFNAIDPRKWKNLLLAPIKDVSGKTCAVICASNKLSRGRGSQLVNFSEEDKILLSSLAITAAGSLHQARLYDEAILRRKQTEALLHITELMSADLGTEKVVSRIIEAAYSLVPAERISLFIVEEAAIAAPKFRTGPSFTSPGVSAPNIDEGTFSPNTNICSNLSKSARSSTFRRERELVCVISKDEQLMGVRIPWGAGIVGHVALTGRSLNIPNAYTDQRFDPSTDRKTGFLTTSILTVPVFDTESRCMAVIQAVNRVGVSTVFISEDVTILESMAVSAGIILRKSLLYHAALQAERRSNALMKLVKIVSNKSCSVLEIIRGVIQVIQSVLSADRVTVFFVDSPRGELFSIANQADVGHSVSEVGYSLKLGNSFAGNVAVSGKSINVLHPSEDPKFNLDDLSLDLENLNSVLCVPVIDKENTVIAVIQAANKKTTASYSHSNYSSHTAPNALTISHGNSEMSESASLSYTAFSSEDVSIMEAFATEVSSTLHRCFTDAILEHYTRSSVIAPHETEGLSSLVDFYNSRPKREITPQLLGAFLIPESLSASKSNSNILSRQLSWPEIRVSPLKDSASELYSFSFDVFKYESDDLLGFSIIIFQEIGLVDEFNIPLRLLQSFLLQICNSYRPNPFHNWYHAFSVFHFSFLFLRKTCILEKMSKLDVLALLVAALCHDLDHPGHTNSFEINTDSEKALLYNDHSVLENHHSATLFNILADSKFNIFVNIAKSSYRSLRSSIINSILSTDMAIHFERTKDLEQRNSKVPFELSKESERQFMLDMMVHSSDLSGQVFPTPIACKWEEKISEEFLAQAEKEVQLGLPVAPFMQNMADFNHRTKLQVNFIEFVLEPWWKNIARLYPELQTCYLSLQTNKSYFQELIAVHQIRRRSLSNEPTLS